MTGEFAMAVHALVYLDYRGCSLPSEQLAQNICTNAARVRKVMAKLRRAGLVYTREGAVGGYTMAVNAREITLNRVLEAVGEQVISSVWRPGDPQMDCLVSSGMAHVMDELYRDLNGLCAQHLGAITVKEIQTALLAGKRKL